ncbi:MAG: hypothetical protein ACLRS8_04425 [Parabacteroides merdae]
MNKLKQILEFIRALLGFLLNLKKKKTDEKNEKPPRPIPGKLPDDVPDDTPSDSIGIVSGRPRDNGPVGWTVQKVVLGCIGALLTLSEYGQTARDKPPPSWDGH